ncbi:ATP-binding protein [Desertivirga brevis]|uniref:ATP-binding protein n=1 Tax=Desertivirga brevis TaxID=2810310 RepID=UPI001A975ABB|nr:ATP-binding protein [Pedobacter sp. SYSU D00873]
MNLKLRFSLAFSLLFSLLLAALMLTIYYLFSNFRQEEFRDRLSEKAETTVKLLVEVKEVDYQLMKIIDRNSINRLYNEKTLVFDDEMKLIYNSIDNARVSWTKEDLKKVKEENLTFKRYKEYDVLGIHYPYYNKDYYVLISAEDKYGNNKLRYLKYLLAVSFVVSVVLVWVLSFYLSKMSLKPLDSFRKEIQEITDKNLNKRLSEPTAAGEIQALSYSFNQMMNRIDSAYQSQKSFTGNASHELRTPIAKILAQLENVMGDRDISASVRNTLNSVIEDATQLSEIVTSLLLLSEINNKGDYASFSKVRLDEIIFASSAQVAKFHPDFKFQFEIEPSSSVDLNLEVNADEILLQIAFANLFRNAFVYSENRTVQCKINQAGGNLEVVITNTGPTPKVKDTSELFNTFTRGDNVMEKAGSGIGLSIVKRILQYHFAIVEYKTPTSNLNVLVVTIPNSI